LNRALVYVSLFLILVGIGLGIYLVSFLGVLLLIPALLSPTNLPKPRPPTSTQSQPPRRIIPPAPAQPAASAPESQPMTTVSMTSTPMYTPTQYQGYSGPLFSATMFPSLSTMGTPQPTPGPPPPTNQGKEDLLEVVAILAVLRLLSG